MVNLLDWPPELFRSLVDTTVSELGLRSSMKLRLVNQLFNTSVLRAYETLYIFHSSQTYTTPSFHTRHNGLYGTPLIPFLSTFLSRRPHTTASEFWALYRRHWTRDCEPSQPTHTWQLNISVFLHTVLDKLHVQEGERREALSVLLGQIDDVRAYGTDEDGVERAMPGVVMDVLKRGFEPLHFVGLGEHVLPAAILLKLKDIYEPLFEEAAKQPSHQLRSHFFGTPLYAAVKSGQHDLVRRLLRLFNREEEPIFSRPLEGAVITGDMAMINLVLGSSPSTTDIIDTTSTSLQALSLSPNSFQPPSESELRRGLIRAVRLGHQSIVQKLLTHISHQSEEFKSEYLSDCMYYASLYGHVSILRLLVDHGADPACPRPSPDESPRPLDLAAWMGSVDAVVYLLSQLPADAESGMEVFAAIMGDRVAVLRFLLARHGTDDLFEEADQWLSVVWYGIRLRSYDAVRYLLTEARVLDVVAGFKAQPATFGMLLEVCASEGHPLILGVLGDLGMPLDEPLGQGMEGVNRHWTPMMFAQAAGSTAVRALLRERGVEEVDMNVHGKRHFEMQGPRKKVVPRMESQMPVKNAVREQNPYWTENDVGVVVVNCKDAEA